MRIKSILIIAAICFTFCGSSFAADIKLPAPLKSGGPSVLEAIDQRGSAGQTGFSSEKLSPEELSTVLWAASGHNRDGAKWTVPMAVGAEPYCKIYVADETGVYLYNWRDNVLNAVLDKDIRPEIARQEFVQKAPQLFIMVLDDSILAAKVQDADGRKEMEMLAVGSMSQNIYLATQAVGASTRMVFYANRDKIAELLNLPADHQPVCLMPIGKGPVTP